MLYVTQGKLNRIHEIIRLLQPLYEGELVVDKLDQNLFRLVKTKDGAFFKVKQKDVQYIKTK
jgi:hypothetical protein